VTRLGSPAAVVTIGETMALLDAPVTGRLGAGASLPLGFGGAESNVAIGLTRLGVPCTWVGRVGDDALGTFLTRELRAEGVHTLVTRDPSASTGLMIKEHRNGQPWRVRYYRSGSAASRLSPDHIDDDTAAFIRDAAVLHLTGITAALGPTPLAAIEQTIEIARAAGTLVSFDVNHRATLWSHDVAAPVLGRLAAAADVVFAGIEEAALILDRKPPDHAATFDDAEHLAREMVQRGSSTVVVKLGALGALALSERQVHCAPAQAITVVDPVGAGDAFVAGYLSELVARRSVPDCLHTGNACGAAVCQVRGDWEGLPTHAELAEQSGASEVVR
jgi:2-dehydro-3-deoxygluconokinase